MNTNKLTAAQIAANEDFFIKVKSMLNENGVWGYPAEQRIYIMRNGKLCSNQDSIDSIANIVSPAFLKEHFAVDNSIKQL